MPLVGAPRPAAVCGFRVAELWWPFAEPVLLAADQDPLVKAIQGEGLALVGLAAGLAGNRTLDRNRAPTPAGDFRLDFRVDPQRKDLGDMLTAARAAGVSVPLGGLAVEMAGPMRARDGGALEDSALLLVVQALAGRRDETWSPR